MKDKSGMYGEMPKIKIGNYTICDMSDKDNEDRVWVENEQGEGSEFKKEYLLPIIDKFFKENF